MSKMYRWKIPAKNFNFLPPEEALKIAQQFPRGQCSVRYDRANKRVLLVSKNIADITNAIERQVWEHSRCPRLIERGWKAYIVPTRGLMTSNPNLAHGAVFDVLGRAHESESKQVEWQSETAE